MRRFFMLFLILLSSLAQATTIYVTPSGTGTGTSWSNASNSLQTAMNSALSGDTIWVAQGTYFPTTTGNVDTSFYPKNGVVVFGGFSGAEGLLSQRADTTGTTTILSGNLTSILHSKHVVYFAGTVTGTTVLDGFTIRGGSVNIINAPGGGAGIYNAGSPQLSHLSIHDNTATITSTTTSSNGGGAGMYSTSGSPLISDVAFKGNTVFVSNPGSVSSVSGGAALFMTGGSAQFNRVLFDSNKVFEDRQGFGGAVLLFSVSKPQFNNVVFAHNSITHTGTALAGNNLGGGLFIYGNTGLTDTVRLTNILFHHDSAYNGAGMQMLGSRAILTNATAGDNYSQLGYNTSSPAAAITGGSFAYLVVRNTVAELGVHPNGGTAVLDKCLVTKNAPAGSLSNITVALAIYFTSREFEVYSLIPCSPSINSGTNSYNTIATDILGQPRINGGTIDLGAIEYYGPGLTDTLFVNAASTANAPDGLSWAKAFPRLQTALSYACDTVYPKNIWVATGSYKTDYLGNAGNRFTIKKKQKIFGGFAGYESRLDSRDSTGATNATILTGEIQGDGVDSNNARYVVYGSGLDSTTELNSFTIKKGWGKGIGGGVNTGAGIYIRNSTGPILRNLVSMDNTGDWGAGLLCEASNPLIEHVVLINNWARTWGGGLSCYSHSAPTIRHLRLVGNYSAEGGGAYFIDCGGTAEDLEAYGNSAFYGGAGLAIISSTIAIHKAKVVGNFTTGDQYQSGAAGVDVGGYSPGGNDVPSFSDMVVAKNVTAGRGGGISVLSSGLPVVFTNATFAGNIAGTKGCNIGNSVGLVLRNCIVDSAYHNGVSSIGCDTCRPFTLRASLLQSSLPTWVTDSSGNIFKHDPLFVDTLNSDYSLLPGSLAIDTGNNTLITSIIDLAGNPRIFHGRVDMGAYEAQCLQVLSNFSKSHVSRDTLQLAYTGTTNSLDSLIWDFGDGQTLTVKTGFTAPFRHVYSVPGVYNICLAASGACSSSLLCYKDSVTTAGSIAVEGVSKADLHIYPNPAKHTISIEGTAGSTIVLSNAIGQDIKRLKATTTKEHLDISTLPEGVYILQILNTDGSMREIQKIIKQ